MAIASLVLGVLGVFTFIYLVLPILAVVFGSISLRRYHQGYHDRRAAALAGLILGVVALTLASVTIVLLTTLGF